MAVIFLTSKIAGVIGEVTAKHKKMRSLHCGRSCFDLVFDQSFSIRVHSCSDSCEVLDQTVWQAIFESKKSGRNLMANVDNIF